ncbi:MAG: TAT-variant-translocated molybdopterin oxidoreductase, partial [Chitinophagales bacterium]|nr:TAT-variant-translocated molybdopterin oxidoreductase [Chitinophagales bacterium]
MADKIYWKSIEEKDNPELFYTNNENEFSSGSKVVDELVEGFPKSGNTSRRDFLKMLGFSVTAATIAASCEMPVRKSIPYAWKPEEVVPGVANYYASVFFSAGEYNAILVKTREGRPIKI